MKKVALFILSISFAVLPFAGIAHADQQCGDPTQSNAQTTYIACGNGNPANVQNIWGGTNSSVPNIAPGTSFTDEYGLSYTCPAFFPANEPCANITGTDYYKAQMSLVGQSIVAQNLQSEFPQYANLIASFHIQ